MVWGRGDAERQAEARCGRAEMGCVWVLFQVQRENEGCVELRHDMMLSAFA